MTMSPSRWLPLTLAVALGGASLSAQAATSLRLSTLFAPDESGTQAAEAMAERVAERTEGEVTIDVYPASQLGDWTEVHAQLMQGAVDMAIQPLSTNVNPQMAIAWFPYLAPTYAAAREAYSADGYVAELVGDMIDEQNMALLGVYPAGMGGAGFAAEVPAPKDPNAEQGLRIRVWPGGTTHRTMMERLGFEVATVPWAELYTSMQTGVVDGQIGGTAEMAMANFADITETWVQYNDHLELAWIVINQQSLDRLAPEHQQVVRDVAQEITLERFDEVQAADQAQLDAMREAGIEVVTFSDEELAQFADVVRQEVWPEIGDELGEEVMERLEAAVAAE